MNIFPRFTLVAAGPEHVLAVHFRGRKAVISTKYVPEMGSLIFRWGREDDIRLFVVANFEAGDTHRVRTEIKGEIDR